MLKNYFKTAWRSLTKNKLSACINIGGLSVGMAVAMLIAFWIYDEWSFDRFDNYRSIAQVMENQAINGVYQTQKEMPANVADEMKGKFASDFKYIVLSSQTFSHIIAFSEKKFIKTGIFIEPEAPDMLTLSTLEGDRAGLKDPHSIMLSASLAKAMFANADPLGKTIRMDDSLPLKVTGIYKDFPYNSTFGDITFLSPWDLYASTDPETKQNRHIWQDNNWQVFVQLGDNVDMEKVSAKIRTIKSDNDTTVKASALFKATLFLHPMSRWHLYSEFKDGVSIGGRIEYVRLFGLIGAFVLLLACINFMNLSTARSEKRAKEVGIRKALGSVRRQLIIQFFSESLLVALLAFIGSLLFVELSMAFFNEVSDKHISIPWLNPIFWLCGIAFSLLTGLVAGSYPALYLSSFQPVKVLKGVFRAGRLALLPRKILVVVQFTVSTALIIGTVIVFRQVQFARNRPVGYNRAGLMMVQMHTDDIYNHFTAFRSDLLNTGGIKEVAESTSPTTQMGDENGNLTWTGKGPDATADNFAMKGVTQEYAKTIGLQFLEGRDFRTDQKGSDAMTMILSESTVKGMGLKEPIGKTIVWFGYKFTVIGVVKDLVMESPYDPLFPTIYYIAPYPIYTVNIRINPSLSAAEALRRIGPVFTKYSPAEPFDYKFADKEYDAKFRAEERVGKLAGFFTILAVVISCLGLFGLASFVAEQRTREIGVRKVLGATVFSLWKMLSGDLVGLVVLSCLIAIPIAWYFLHQWLQQYAYHTPISWWIFAAAGVGAILITLLTVSFQSIKAAFTSPVKGLRSE
ncbi:MAG TPA: ABC transporter permease [Puia sp.]|jgi:ABC-type antimicrobial peptide transport system permease subunit|nr:ABC transporter permease [Puia sp.]